MQRQPEGDVCGSYCNNETNERGLKISCATYSSIRKIDILLGSQYTGNKRVLRAENFKQLINIIKFPQFFQPFFHLNTLTGCISHCCVVGGNHGIHVHVLITQSNEWCELPTYCCLKSASHIWVPQLLKIKP